MQICFYSRSTPDSTPSWSELPIEVKRLLVAAADTWEDTAQSQTYIDQALAIANQSLDVLVAAYRYFFYKRNNTAALQIATQVMEQIQQSEELPDNWDELGPILDRRKEDASIRLYLNAYAASGLILARLGAVDQAKAITARISQIDTKREFGAETVFQILTQPDEED
jgi:hypothetical protein